ncbi:MAG: OmpA family protein [Candidatus Delongbacteria bacterium]|nr:OmpA family protein [Candidatus Delongbacteria bacterium]
MIKNSNSPVNAWISFTDVILGLLIIIIVFFILNILNLFEYITFVQQTKYDKDRLIELFQKDSDVLSEFVNMDSLVNGKIFLKSDITFDFDSHVINPKGKEILEIIGKVYKSFLDENDMKNMIRSKNYTLLIIGHTDTVGDSYYNYNLSQKRSESVLYFWFKNVFQDSFTKSRYKILGTGVGEKFLIYDTPDEFPCRKNRCIEITLKSDILDFVRSN